MKKIICFVLLIISVFGLTGCKKNVLDKITKKGEIVIVTSPDYPAFEFTDEYSFHSSDFFFNSFFPDLVI